MFSFKYHAENETGRQFPDFVLLFKKALYETKASGLFSKTSGQVSIYFHSGHLHIQ